jgi:two-component system, NtrC family, sensor histidine kinase HydH
LLRQVLFNLLLNAIQAVDGRADSGDHRGEAPPRRRWKSATTAPAFRPNAPGNFQALLHHAPKGTGLGLAVVQQIVLAHGWEIECLANEPKGAVFRITHLKLAADFLSPRKCSALQAKNQPDNFPAWHRTAQKIR